MLVVEDDRELMSAYRSISFLRTLENQPVYLRLYGPPGFKNLLRVVENAANIYLMECDQRHVALRRN
jgi:hypothetical protein